MASHVHLIWAQKGFLKFSFYLSFQCSKKREILEAFLSWPLRIWRRIGATYFQNFKKIFNKFLSARFWANSLELVTPEISGKKNNMFIIQQGCYRIVRKLVKLQVQNLKLLNCNFNSWKQKSSACFGLVKQALWGDLLGYFVEPCCSGKITLWNPKRRKWRLGKVPITRSRNVADVILLFKRTDLDTARR